LHQSAGIDSWVQPSLCLAVVGSDSYLSLAREHMYSRRMCYFFSCLFSNHLFM